MAKQKMSGTEKVIIVLGIIFLFYALSHNTFLGSLITTCDNTEPVSVSAYTTYFTALNKTGTDVHVLYGNVTKANTGLDFKKYQFGQDYLYIADKINSSLTCDDSLNIMKDSFTQNSNGSITQIGRFIYYNNKKILQLDDVFLWCNYKKTAIISTNLLSTFADYFNTFEVCTYKDTEAIVSNQSACINSKGTWTNSTCYCSDGSLLKVDQVCPDTSTTVTTTAQPSSAGAFSLNEPVSTGFKFDTKTLAYIGIAILGMYLLYYFFEKGPDKGFFRKKKGGMKK